nr:MAG: RNA-dependent RNA polymerase [Mitovirus sp.]
MIYSNVMTKNFINSVSLSFISPKSRLNRKAWISQKEFRGFYDLISWAFAIDKEMQVPLKLLSKRILTLFKKSGPNFAFLYMKEVSRLVIRFVSGHPETKSRKVLVSVDPNGLPNIIPVTFRSLIVNMDYKMLRVILTSISIYRVFPTKPRIDLGTITDGFTGITRVLDPTILTRAVKELILTRPRKANLKFIILESASPLASKSTISSILDVMAYWDSPLSALYMLRMVPLTLKGVLFTVWFLGMMILLLPAFVVIKTIKGWSTRLPLGKLSVVYDQAGKARIVAMTNYFIQVVLRPVHQLLFDLLSRIPQDGTFDQHKPLRDLVKTESTEWFYCYDLSAATDRLPIDVQAQVLNIIEPGLGYKWSNLLDIEWLFKRNYFKYSVGQPMGALSSWASLAFTHHCIVRYAAIQEGIYHFRDYCVLGDDIVIRHKLVAERYLRLMDSLGVSINLNKSVISKDFAEFAKVYEGPGISFTPLGAGLILQTLRMVLYRTQGCDMELE